MAYLHHLVNPIAKVTIVKYYFILTTFFIRLLVAELNNIINDKIMAYELNNIYFIMKYLM